MHDFLHASQYFFSSPWPVFWMMLGTTLGIIVGAMPGLTGAMLIALTLPLTFGMPPTEAMILLVSMYVGSISGGLVTATLLRMPGTPASIMTTLDGYPLAQQGKPGRALGLGVSASFAGGLISWLFLVCLTRPMAEVSFLLGPFEYFSLVLMALVLIASVSGKDLLKGILSGFLGILATMPGTAPSTGEVRWTFGFTELNDGFKLLPVLIGLFAVNQILVDVLNLDRPIEQAPPHFRGIVLSVRDWMRHGANMLRSSLIGTWIGILPGIGANIASVLAYTAARNLSRTPEKFGKGAEEGIIASEAANNATVGGALVPLIALGIPGSVIDAILLGALLIHGLQPGPLLFKHNPDIVYIIMVTVFWSNCFMFIFMLAAAPLLTLLTRMERAYLIPVLLVFCIIGAYALSNRFFDVWVMLAFGVIGFLMERGGLPLAPFVIGFVLAPLAEENFAKALMQSNGSYLPLLTRPIALVFLLISLVLLVWPFWRSWRLRTYPKRGQTP